jgi:hypothetical protein
MTQQLWPTFTLSMAKRHSRVAEIVTHMNPHLIARIRISTWRLIAPSALLSHTAAPFQFIEFIRSDYRSDRFARGDLRHHTDTPLILPRVYLEKMLDKAKDIATTQQRRQKRNRGNPQATCWGSPTLERSWRIWGFEECERLYPTLIARNKIRAIAWRRGIRYSLWSERYQLENSNWGWCLGNQPASAHHHFRQMLTATTTASASSESNAGYAVNEGSRQGLTAQMQNSEESQSTAITTALTDDLNHVAIKLLVVSPHRTMRTTMCV